MFHEPVLYHKRVFYLFQHVFVLDHASIVLFPNKILLLLFYGKKLENVIDYGINIF